MRTMKVASFVLLFMTVMTVGIVLADSPHFVSASTSIDTAGCTGLPQPSGCGDATVSFKEAGLGSAVTVNYDFSGNATADYGCINGGGKHPQASNKEASGGPVSSTASFTSTKAGNITGSFSVAPPPPPGTFSCPSGQTAVLADVTYSDLALTDTTNSIDATVSPTSVTSVFFTFK